MNKIFSTFKRFPRITSATILLSLFLLFSFPALAQVYSLPIPRIEAIKGSEGVPPAYRLIISQPENMVYVFCPSNFEAELDYVRNVKTIRCQRFSTP